MFRILPELDKEWSQLANSPIASRAVVAWSVEYSELDGCQDLADVLARRRDPAHTDGVLRALAGLAPHDPLASRTLLQALIPGIVRLATSIAADDPAAIEEMVSLAWERIRTYPAQRHGSVAGNVLLDVRKRYREHWQIESPRAPNIEVERPDPRPTPEEEVMGRLLLVQLAEAQHDGVVSASMLATILRTRLVGDSLAELADEQSISPKRLCHRRWRSELRLRSLPLAG